MTALLINRVSLRNTTSISQIVLSGSIKTVSISGKLGAVHMIFFFILSNIVKNCWFLLYFVNTSVAHVDLLL